MFLLEDQFPLVRNSKYLYYVRVIMQCVDTEARDINFSDSAKISVIHDT